MNLCQWNDAQSVYIHKYSKQVIAIKTPVIAPLILGTSDAIRPKNIIVASISLTTAVENLYSFKGSSVSVMDGYYDI
jgi:hypothetical protein